MRNDFKELRLKQLARSLSSFKAAKNETRPQRGWLRAIREALGLSLEDVGKMLDKPRVRIQEFEKAESEYRITLQSLRRVADAMGCELVYAIVPKSGSILDLAHRLRTKRHSTLEQETKHQVRSDVLGVEQNMALENQAAGNVEKLIETETKRRLKKNRHDSRS